MEKTKASVLRTHNPAHQQAIVEAMLPKRTRTVKHVIPGGKYMLEQLSIDDLRNACYNWLRGVHSFEQVTISLAADPYKYRLKEEKLIDLDTNNPYPEWMTNPRGKRWLAELLANALANHKLVQIVAKKDGIYYYVDADDKFSPKRKATKADVEALKEEDTETTVSVGDMIPNEDWEPYIEFIPTRRSQYAAR